VELEGKSAVVLELKHGVDGQDLGIGASKYAITRRCDIMRRRAADLDLWRLEMGMLRDSRRASIRSSTRE
jgi:hypothetical protein